MEAREVRCNNCQTVNSNMRKLCKNCKAPLPPRAAALAPASPAPILSWPVAQQSPSPPPRVEVAPPPVAVRLTAPRPLVQDTQTEPVPPEPSKRRVIDEPSGAAGRDPRPLRRTPGADGAAAQPPLSTTSGGHSAGAASPQTSDASSPQGRYPSDNDQPPSRSIAGREKRLTLQHSPWLQTLVLVLLMGLGCAVGVWLSTPG